MTPDEKAKMQTIPEIMRQKIFFHQENGKLGKKERVVLSYATPVKLRSVVRWRERMARKGITVKKLADVMSIRTIRISEWLNFSHEPSEENFQKVEKALYDLGA